MSKPLPASDFRAMRITLEPTDFQVDSSGKEIPPSDLVDRETWENMTMLPDHVSICTSNHNGTLLKRIDGLWEAWLDAIGDDQDLLHDAMLPTIDEFQAVTFNALTGYYRQAIGCLRNILELVTIGTFCQVCGMASEFSRWLTGDEETKMLFGTACDKLWKASIVQPLNAHLWATLADGIFDQKSDTYQRGWARRLHFELSNYSHSRPNYTNDDWRKSNGPIYVPEALARTSELYFETSALCYLLIKLARPGLVLPAPAVQFFEPGKANWMNLANSAYHFLFQPVTRTQSQRS